MEVQQALRDLIDTVQLLQRKATLAERPLLRLTMELLELCASTEPQACMIELLQVEVGQQKRWVMDYLNQQKGNEQMTRLADDFAKPSEDHERLLLRYCQETWEGARAIALVLDVPLLRPTWKVMHHREAFSSPKGQYDITMPFPTSGKGLELLIIQICCGIVVYVSVCLRLWAQHINRKRPSLHNKITTRKVSLHDVLMHVSVFFYTVQAVIVIRGIIEGGIGQHGNDIDQTEITIGFQTWYFGELIYPVLSCFTKTSVILFLQQAYIVKFQTREATNRRYIHNSRQRLGVGFGTHSRLNENADSMAKEGRHSSPVEFRRGCKIFPCFTATMGG
ncbi:hypothetical protein FOC4_g10001860 [Fusarium odoratissimum]|uniref:Rhodopsin domain-containing protein n=1 Tax=Fusarium oxysporum f. sp. cubense (strain race 4) TaxID=2502994 RepID=N1S8N3_FUSC4|nr:hypothetical protein FOC4_g10001860 [Fusarium odoratissimum]